MRVRITLTEEMLGTKPADPEVFGTYVASKHPSGTPERDELENAESVEQSGTTVFHKQDGVVGIYDYQVKGFFKDAAQFMRQADGAKSKTLTAYKTKIDGLIFVLPRFIGITLPTGTTLGVCERPLRAETAQGPRVSLCRSQSVPAGSTLEFEVRMLATKLGKGEDAVLTAALVAEWLAYGELRGLGQWRNSGKGRFKTEILPE